MNTEIKASIMGKSLDDSNITIYYMCKNIVVMTADFRDNGCTVTCHYIGAVVPDFKEAVLNSLYAIFETSVQFNGLFGTLNSIDINKDLRMKAANYVKGKNIPCEVYNVHLGR